MNPADLYETYFVPGMFRPLSRVLVSLAAAKQRDRVLDLACGTGIIARQLAPVVGAEGRVVALDLRPGMLEAASKLTVPYGAPIEWVEGDATKLDFPNGSFDLVVCQQGLQFFPDRAAALAEVKRVLRPGGRVVIAVWQDLDKQALWHDLVSSELRHLGAIGVPTEDMLKPYSLSDPGELRQLLESAGLHEVEITTKSIECDFPADGLVEYALQAYTAVMPQIAQDAAAFRAFVETVTRDTEAVRAQYTRDGRLRFPMHTNVAVARA